ncbi:unnamed protein product [Spirodela intermedia]|uniref:Protein ENHANCED DISEASE RESISTANCE 2 C-terminal domain-containing protein n=1 Tax=Spirodela intermedia TaxID=51605 RepID=A0A7I8JW63_SPIIN|nr:unnamed protein product [Spirodela intermedia]CAA6673712.1 unnamed protein product [Spirodela intermedia]
MTDALEAEPSPDWIEKIKSGGAVPHLEPDNCPNGWASPEGDIFMVRGPDYLSSRVKIPGGDYLLKPLGFDWLKSSSKISEVLNDPNSRVRRAIDADPVNKHFVWAFNLQVPCKDNHSAILYFVSTEPTPEDSLMDRFLKGDDAFRNSRLKLIANIQAICLIGRAISCKYIIGENFIEVDIDIGSSMVANAIVHLAFGYITTLTVDLAFLIESQAESELPERLLGAVRISDLQPDSASLYELPSEEQAGDMQSSLPSRLWKSIGEGFSQLLHPGSQDTAGMPVEGNGNGNHQGKDSKTEESSDEDDFEDAEN